MLYLMYLRLLFVKSSSQIYLSRIFIVMTFLLISSLIIQPAYAKEASYTKLAYIEKEFLEEAFKDVKSYPNLFGGRVTDVKLLQYDDDKKVISIKAKVSGFTINGDFEYTVGPKGEHIVNVIDGNLKGTKIVTTLMKRPGSDGTPDKRTDVIMQLDLKTSGWLRIGAAFLTKKDLEFGMEGGVWEFEKLANEIKEKKLKETTQPKIFQPQPTQQTDKKTQRDNTGSVGQGFGGIIPNISMEAWQAQFLDQNYVLATGSVTSCHQMKNNPITLRLNDPGDKIVHTLTIPLTDCSFNTKIKIGQNIQIGDWKATAQFGEYQKQVSFSVTKSEKIFKESVIVEPNPNLVAKKLPGSFSKAEFQALEFEISEEGQMIIVGKLEKFSRGEPVYITITKPDGTFDIRMTVPSNNGNFGTKAKLDDNYPEGLYMIKAEHGLQDSKAVSYKATTYEKVSNEKIIPSWVKNNARWWSEDQLKDSDFYLGIQYLIDKGIIEMPETETDSDSQMIASDWVKISAKWWADGLTTDENFINQIESLIEQKIIRI